MQWGKKKGKCARKRNKGNLKRLGYGGRRGGSGRRDGPKRKRMGSDKHGVKLKGAYRSKGKLRESAEGGARNKKERVKGQGGNVGETTLDPNQKTGAQSIRGSSHTRSGEGGLTGS